MTLNCVDMEIQKWYRSSGCGQWGSKAMDGASVPPSSVLMAVIKTDPKVIHSEKVVATSRRMIELLDSEWAMIYNSRTASRVPVANFI